jgi:hypothetical protein
MTKDEALKLALTDYMAAFGQALEAHGIHYGQQQVDADQQAREALARPLITIETSLRLNIEFYKEKCQALEKELRELKPRAVLVAQSTEQEPVAWGVKKRGGMVWYVNDSRSVCQGYANHYQHRDANGSDQDAIPLYTSPTRQEWVGLTDVQHEEIMEWLGHDVSSQTFYAIEAKLKEKNT